MEAKELRIGNFVKNEHGVVAVNASWFLFDMWETLKPIPITEEWLLKLGFSMHMKMIGVYGYAKDCWFISNEMDFMVMGSSVILRKLDFVHQLQNLYYALTGEELCLEQ